MVSLAGLVMVTTHPRAGGGMARKPFDYSKWDKIELSDDEEDVHPNIDKDSWFRWKHQARIERSVRGGRTPPCGGGSSSSLPSPLHP